MTKTKRTLTIDPANADGLKDGHKQQTHATGCIRVKELEHVHATLTEQSHAQSEEYRTNTQDNRVCSRGMRQTI